VVKRKLKFFSRLDKVTDVVDKGFGVDVIFLDLARRHLGRRFRLEFG